MLTYGILSTYKIVKSFRVSVALFVSYLAIYSAKTITKIIVEMKKMITGIFLTILLGGGISAVGAFIKGYLGFWACAIILVIIGVLTMVLYQNRVAPIKKKKRRASDNEDSEDDEDNIDNKHNKSSKNSKVKNNKKDKNNKKSAAIPIDAADVNASVDALDVNVPVHVADANTPIDAEDTKDNTADIV